MDQIIDRLPGIPWERIGSHGFPVLVEKHRSRLEDLLSISRARYTQPVLWLGDALTRRWLTRADIPYRDELHFMTQAVGSVGAWMLNFSYEWGCTAAAVGGPDEPPRLLRVMDWFLDGLGRTLIAVEREGKAGSWVNFTWPGFIGAIQGVAPGRFALCLNQAPPPDTGFGMVANWGASHLRTWKSRGMPPVLMARLCFDEDADFAAALRRVQETPLCAPVFVTLVGCRPGEVATVERTPDKAVTHGTASISNHWLTPGLGGPPTAWGSQERLAAIRSIQGCMPEGLAPFSWLREPVLNSLTRVVVDTVPATGHFQAQGWEATGPATDILSSHPGGSGIP